MPAQLNVDRDHALDSLSAPGTLLVLCSLVDNMPYVVAEASVCLAPKLAHELSGKLLGLPAHAAYFVSTLLGKWHPPFVVACMFALPCPCTQSA